MDKIPPSEIIIFKGCVIDGGALLHRVHWPPNSVPKDIFTQYSMYVQRHYGKYQQVIVVFDERIYKITRTNTEMK